MKKLISIGNLILKEFALGGIVMCAVVSTVGAVEQIVNIYNDMEDLFS